MILIKAIFIDRINTLEFIQKHQVYFHYIKVLIKSLKEKFIDNPIDPLCKELLLWHVFTILIILFTYLWIPFKISFEYSTIL